MKKYIFVILMLLTFSSHVYAEQQKTSGKWFPGKNYQKPESHSIALEAAKKWIQNRNRNKNYDYIYRIKNDGENYLVFIQYIVAYSEKNERLSPAGGFIMLNVNKSGDVIDIMPGA